MRGFRACFAACVFSVAPLAAEAITQPTPPPTPPPSLTEFSDKLCPSATEPVREYNAEWTKSDTPVDTVISTATHIVDVYHLCGNELQTTMGAEGLHYGEVQEARFEVVIGRLQRLLGNVNSAHDVLVSAVAHAKDTIDWQSSRQSVFRSNNVGVGSGSSNSARNASSVYRALAMQVRDEANAELALLPKSTAGSSTPKPK